MLFLIPIIIDMKSNAKHAPPPELDEKLKSLLPVEMMPVQHYQAQSSIIRTFILPGSIVHLNV